MNGCRWDGTSAGWRSHLEALAALPCEAGRSVRALNEALASGFYVSAINGRGQKALVEGPYERHEEALVRVQPVSRAWGDADPHAWHYAWGTARVTEAEIRAVGLSAEQDAALCESMDLDANDIAELFERAEHEWESLKDLVREEIAAAARRRRSRR